MAFTIDLENKIAIVTGASRGIGYAIAKSLAEAGATVVGIARSFGALQKLKQELEVAGKLCFVHVCDISKRELFGALLEEIQSKFDSIDILVNNAGVYITEPVRDTELAQWSAVLETNCTAAFMASRAVLPAMVKKGAGRIIFISSVSGKTGEAYGAAYSASKFAMLGLMQSLAVEQAPFGITANAVCPGWVDTDMAHSQINDEKWCRLNGIDREQSEEITRLSVPQQRLISPAEVADLVVFLCSDYARGITGQAINICGGLSIR